MMSATRVYKFATVQATSTVLLLGAVTLPVQAQESPVKHKESALEEVVVTARRREESMQTVPVAITALSSESLREQHIEKAQDLQGRVPSLIVGAAGQTRNTETITIRGQGATYGASPGVVTYYSEVPLINDSLTNAQGGPGMFFDLANLQVLKGPQGTLFGRNTTGGAVLLTPKKPTNANEGYIQASVGNFGHFGTEVVGNVPLIDDTLLVRAGLKTDKRDGFTRDVVSGTKYDNRDYYSGRLGITWKPADSVENYLLGYYTHSRDNGTGDVLTNINSAGLNQAFAPYAAPGQTGCDLFNLLSGSTNCGQDFVQAQKARGIRRVILSANPSDDLKTWGVIDKLSISLGENITLRNIMSYQRYKHSFRWDLDGSRVPFDDIINPNGANESNTSAFSEEIQLQGSVRDGALEYVVGVYYEKSKPEGDQSQVAVTVFQPALSMYGQKNESYAPYAQLTYDLGDIFSSVKGLKLTMGVRYNRDKLNAFSTYTGYHTARIDDSATTWTAGLDYTLPWNALIYAKVSRGYKGSAFSAVAVNPAHYTADPEYVTSYETGYKSDFEIGSVPARLNMAAYYTDYKDMQRATSDIYQPPGAPAKFGSAMYNIGKARIYGFELSSMVEPFDGMQLGLTYSYTNAEYRDYKLPVGSAAGKLDCSGAVIPFGGRADLSCIPYQFAAKNQFSVSARYRLPIDEAYGDVSGTVTYSWIDNQPTAPSSVPSTEPNSILESYGLVNASMDWKGIMRSNFDIQIYATNLTDEKYRISNANIYQDLFVQASIYGEPRMYGMSLRYHWGGQ